MKPHAMHTLAITFVILLTTAAFTAAAGGNPLAGVWQLETPAGPGPVVEYREDGSFVLYIGNQVHTGRIDAAGGKFTSISDAGPQNNDGGDFKIIGDKLWMRGKLGDGTWQRRPGPFFPTVVYGETYLPANLPALSRQIYAHYALPWRGDAFPALLNVQEIPYSQGRAYQVVFHYISPADGAGLMVTVNAVSITPRPVTKANWGDAAYPVDFLDLPVVIRKARQDGMVGQLREASMTLWKERRAAWMLKPRGPGGYTYHALTGQRIKHDITGYVEQYNKDWAEANRNLKALLSPREEEDPYEAEARMWKNIFGAMNKRECEAKKGGHFQYNSCYIY